MAVSISGDGAVTGVASINTDVSSTELGYLDGVTSAIQPQIAGAGGLVLVASQSFSAASSVSLDNVFSDTYDNYRIMLRVATASGAVSCKFRMRASGTDDSSAQYQTQELSAGGTSTYGSRFASQTEGRIGWINNAHNALAIEVFSPYVAEKTGVISHCAAQLGGTTPEAYMFTTGHNVASAFDGISIYPTSSSITGTVRVYGYAQ